MRTKGENKMMYRVIKVDAKGNEKDYGVMCEEDMKMVVKGYKQDDVIEDLYKRKGSTSFFVVEEQ